MTCLAILLALAVNFLLLLHGYLLQHGKLNTPISSSPLLLGPPPCSQYPRAHFAPHSTSSPSNWLVDSGTSHHITNDLNNLSLHFEYEGSKEIMIGDGNSLKISCIGSTSLPSYYRNTHLSNVLYFPTMTKNLSFVSKFCSTNNVSIEFFPLSFVVKDLNTGAKLMKG